MSTPSDIAPALAGPSTTPRPVRVRTDHIGLPVKHHARPQGHRTRKLPVVVGVGLLVAASCAAGAYAATGDTDAATSPSPSASAPGQATRIQNMSKSTRAEMTANMAPSDREPFDQFAAQADAGRIRVYSGEGVAPGWVSPADFDHAGRAAEPRIVPVRNDAGQVIGYWNGPLGFLPFEVVEDPAFDLDAAVTSTVTGP